jgi:hypothetical protein
LAARRAAIVLIACATASLIAACGGGARHAAAPQSPSAGLLSGLPAADRPVPVGRGPGYRIPALSRAVAERGPVDGLRCLLSHPRQYGIHIELFAHRRVIPVSSGIGVAPPVRRAGVYVLGGGCSYPLRTLEPTGVVRIDRGLRPSPTLGTLFTLWGQRLSTTRLAGFSGGVLAFVDGRRWRISPRAIPLARHAQIVLEVDGALPPHPSYEFPPGL